MKNQMKARPLPLFFVAILTVLFFIAGQARTASAVTVSSNIEGTLVKGSLPDVYFVGTDGKRYVFPNERIFHSWYADFSTVKTVTDEELAALPIAGNVTYRPGTRLVKVQTDPKVYAVAADGTLRWVSTEDLAKELFGSDWSKKVDDVPDAYFTNYKQGTDIKRANDYSPSSEQQNGSTIGGVNIPAPAVGHVPETNRNTNTPVTHEETSAFKIIKAEVYKMDQNYEAAEDVRSFGFEFNLPPTGARLTIVEKNTGTTFFSDPASGNTEGVKSLVFIPDNWPAKLKPSTTYLWKLVAYAAEHATAAQMATASGEFTTSDFKTPAPESGETTEAFKITGNGISTTDADNNIAPDVRTFTFTFNKPYAGASLSIVEKTTGTVFRSGTQANTNKTDTTVKFTPVGWTAKLKPSTAYTWKLVAYAAANATAAQTVTMSGDFTTTDFPVSTGTESHPSTDTSTGGGTNTPTTGQTTAFKITSVKVDKIGADGKPAEDVRSFGITFSAPAKGVRLIITEKASNTVFYSQPVANGAVLTTTTYVSPGDWTAKLKPSTAYTWKIVAYSANDTTSERLVYDIATGDFTTTDFSAAGNNGGSSANSTSSTTAFNFCPVGEGGFEGCCAGSGTSFTKATLPPTAGMLIRATSSPAVYYYSMNGKRYVIPNKDVMISWFGSNQDLLSGTSSVCHDVKQLADADIATIAIGGNMGIRPGTYIVKNASDSKLYVLSHARTIRPLATTALAEQIYPGTSTQRLKVISSALFGGYKMGTAVTSADDYDSISEYNTTAEYELNVETANSPG